MKAVLRILVNSIRISDIVLRCRTTCELHRVSNSNGVSCMKTSAEKFQMRINIVILDAYEY